MSEKDNAKVHCSICEDEVDARNQFVWSLGICSWCLQQWGLEDLQTKMRMGLP